MFAGTDKHEYTSYSSMHSIFKFFTRRYEETINPSTTTATPDRVKLQIQEAAESGDVADVSKLQIGENIELQEQRAKTRGRPQEQPVRPQKELTENAATGSKDDKTDTGKKSEL